MDAVMDTAMALGKDVDAVAVGGGLEHAANRLAGGLGVDHDVLRTRQDITEKGDLADFALGDEPDFTRDAVTDGDNVEKALMVGDEHGRVEAVEIFEAVEIDLDSACKLKHSTPESHQ